jgi:hypothetical protein
MAESWMVMSLNKIQIPRVWHNQPPTAIQKSKVINSILLGAIASSFTRPRQVNAIQSSTIEETKLAIKQIETCINEVKKMQKLAEAKDYQKVGDILSSSSFQQLDNTFGIIVRSSGLNAEDKKALGTIKRYGLVADALIMLGGLSGELKAGGITLESDISSLQKPIEDTEFDDDTETPRAGVNGDEVVRYLKLSLDSLEDIYRIVKPILSQ